MFDSISKQLKARRLINQRAPYRRSDGVRVDQVLTTRWWTSVVEP